MVRLEKLSNSIKATPRTARPAPIHCRGAAGLPEKTNASRGATTMAKLNKKADLDADVVSKPMACDKTPSVSYRPVSKPAKWHQRVTTVVLDWKYRMWSASWCRRPHCEHCRKLWDW